MKRFFSIVVSAVLLFQLIPVSSFAYDNVFDENNIITNTTVSEEKLYCNATLEDDFFDDCVIVVINHANSIIDRIFTVSDFPGVDVKEITYSLKHLQ